MADIRLLLVDDEWLVRAGLRTMLSGQEGITIVGEASDGSTIAELVRSSNATVVLMDIRMPNINGVDATAIITALPNPPAVIVLTTFDNDNLILRSLRAGASGFLLKDTPPAELVAAIRAAAAGEPTLSPSVLRKLMARFTEPAPARPPVPGADRLTPAERRVALAVARGLSNTEIAADLFVSVTTVKSHVARLFDKLNVSSRVQIALLFHDEAAR